MQGCCAGMHEGLRRGLKAQDGWLGWGWARPRLGWGGWGGDGRSDPACNAASRGRGGYSAGTANMAGWGGRHVSGSE